MACDRCREELCEVEGCAAPAEWEGWWRVRDGFGIPGGLLQRRRVCGEHRSLLLNREPETAGA